VTLIHARIEVRPEFRPTEECDTSAIELWKRRELAVGALGIFLYVGPEVAIGRFVMDYFTLPKAAT
jgi:fucose permease